MKKQLKIQVKLILRFLTDVFSLEYFRFAKKGRNISFSHSTGFIQDIKPSETFENKLFNISKAIEQVNCYTLMPNEIFSFWKIIGNPQKGYKKGRNLVGGKISEEAGGGLCQVSGIIYYQSVLAGLEIVERHNHSMDIYTEESRFTPLGTDATVVYGYKDLRIKNNFAFPVKFHLSIINNTLHIKLQSNEQISERSLTFEIKENTGFKYVNVKDTDGNFINQSVYLKVL